MKYLVSKSIVHVLGTMWMPCSQAAMSRELSAYDIRSVVDRGDGIANREALEEWLCLNIGDFSGIDDFYASLEVDGETIEIPWKDEESEFTFSDLMYPSED